jgi:hypothetical protein
MHQDAANRVRSEATRLIPSTVMLLVMPIASEFSR